ncbi:uncharacterized protein LOC111574101 [Amphiprion ocellaris]|uniref:uncharacterized protein LOC111574101 n=1 Tax=Amphiprion ocellaris TaxID=80972 RepID=UPI0024115A2D|nr:uncharacterized protein LOC111574101 [Amphiprion ocellaris]XP_054874333.1 uncharacterized protein LOC111574101 [Amphiprion ocellaris]
MEKYFQPAWMQTVTCLNALKSDDDDGWNLWKRRYAYFPSCDHFELDPYSLYQTAVSESRPAPGGLHMRAMKQDSSPRVKASCNLSSDAEAPSSMNRSPDVADSSWILKTLHQVTFSSRYPDPCTCRGHKTVGGRYLYTPPTGISGFVDAGFTQIHPKRLEPEAESKLREAKEPPVEIIQNHRESVEWSRKKEESLRANDFLH